MIGGRRRVALGLLVAGLASGAGSLACWGAAPAGAAALFTFDLAAGARGFNYFNPSAADAGLGDPGAAVGETRATLETGPIGYGLATVAWPGPIASNAGTLLLVVRPDTPQPAAEAANYPVRAESRSGEEPPERTYSDLPGTTLRSSADQDSATADADIAGAAGVPGTFGSTKAHSEVASTAEGGRASSWSLVEDIDLGGVIEIDSVRSEASATTDGSKGDGTARTLVTGLTIGGQPATIDEHGVKIGGADQPANAVANQLAQQALSSAGFEIVLSAPSREVDGGAATVHAGSLVISHEAEGGGFGTLVLGGATAAVSGVVGDPAGLVDTGSFDGSVDDPGRAAFELGAGGATLEVGGTGGADGSGATPGDGSGPVTLGGVQPVSTTGKPLRPASVVLAVGGAALLAAGLKRLSDDVLGEAPPATACSLEALE